MIGDSKEQIEQCLNCTKPECNNCLRTSERKASLVDQHKEQVKELYERGLSDRQIAKRLHCGHNTVGACRRALGLPPLKERQGGQWKEMMSNAICPEETPRDSSQVLAGA